MNALYTDGGVIGRNPSQDGGTWAWVRTVSNSPEPEENASGVLLPDTICQSQVTNNNSELYALLRGISALPEGWEGDVCSDSQVALGWYFWKWKQEKIPDALRELIGKVQRRSQARGLCLKPVVLAGHPTPADLEAGFRQSKAPHLPVSRYNVRCDDLCNEQTRIFLKARQPQVTLPENPEGQEFEVFTGEIRLFAKSLGKLQHMIAQAQAFYGNDVKFPRIVPGKFGQWRAYGEVACRVPVTTPAESEAVNEA